MESPWKGLSGMDAAKGKDRPRMACFADPWSGDGRRGPGAKRRAEVGASVFGSFWGNAKRDSRVRRETKRSAHAVTKTTTAPRPSSQKLTCRDQLQTRTKPAG